MLTVGRRIFRMLPKGEMVKRNLQFLAENGLTVDFSRFRTRDLKVYRDLLCKLQIQGGQKEKGHLKRLLRNRVYDKSWKKRAILQCYN